MKKLIINADDFGLSVGINNGIIDGLKKGFIKDTSLIAGSDAYEHAVDLAKKNNIKNIGVHVVLAKEIPSAQKYYRFSWRYFLGIVNNREIHFNIKNQILKIKNDGFNITHIDSHQHIHMMPRILKIYVQLAKEFNIRFIRFPYEAKIPDLFDFRNVIKVFCLRAVCILSKHILVKNDIRHSDYFYGHFYSGRLNKESVFKMLSGIKEGITELSCHPGYLTDEIRTKYPWHSNCENELLVLSDPRFSEAVKKNNIELVSYADI